MTVVRADAYSVEYVRYVESVVRVSDEHRAACERATGASGEPRLSGQIRWPGYVGSNFAGASIRILCAAQVHHGPELHRTAQGIEAILKRIAAEGGAPELIQRMGLAYEQAIKQWGPWADFEKILMRLGPAIFGPAEIAYTNVAKCWQNPSTSDCEKPMEVCAPAFPLDRLAQAIGAQVILLMSASGTMSRVGLREDAVALFNFGGRSSNARLREIGDTVRERFVGPAHAPVNG